MVRQTDLHLQLRDAALFAQRRRMLYPYFDLTQTIEITGVTLTLRHPESGAIVEKTITWEDLMGSHHNPLTAAMATFYAKLMVAVSREPE